MMLQENSERDWKQINFRTVKTVLGMEFLHELYNRYHPEINCIRFKNTVMTTDGKQVTSYAPQEEWDFMGRWFSKRFLRGDEEVIESLRTYLSEPKERFHGFLERMDETDVTELDREELAMHLIDVQYVPLTELYTVNHVQIEHALDIAIDQLLGEEFEDDEEFSRAKSALIYADRSTVGVEEKRAFYELVQEGIDQGVTELEEGEDNEVYEALEDHVDEYRYIHSAYGAEPYPFSYYIERYNDVAEKGPDHVETKLTQIQEADERSEKRRQEYLDRIDSDRLAELVDLMADVGTLRDRNKARLGKSTKHRERLLDEISDRTGVDREQLDWYFLREICELLEHDREVEEQRLEDRRDGMVFTRGEHVETDEDLSIEDEDSSSRLEGECASVGTYEGTVRIVHDSSDGERMNLGDVMVAPGTDFDLINAMQRAGAIVTEEGGILSHAAVISRELDIPCIIGVTEATERLEEGERVRIEADTGEITVLGDSI